MQIKPATKRQCQGQTQQTSQNAHEKAVHRRGLLGSSRHPEGHNECQQYFQPRYQPGTDPRSEVINSILVGSAPCLKGQDERIDGDYPHHDEEAQNNDYKGSAENAEPPNSGRIIHGCTVLTGDGSATGMSGNDVFYALVPDCDVIAEVTDTNGENSDSARRVLSVTAIFRQLTGIFVHNERVF
jgi:hypothetical protein